MGKWRWRKSIKLAPGVRMNLGSGGTSWSFGPRGGSISVGKRGVHANQSFLGMSRRVRLSGPPRASETLQRGVPTPTQTVTMPATVVLETDGTLRFQDQDGADLPEQLVAIAKKQAGDKIREFLQEKCEEMSEEVDAIANLHFDTPNPRVIPRFEPMMFLAEPPQPPTPQKLGLLDKIFKARRATIESVNAEMFRRHKLDVANWELVKLDHIRGQEERRQLIEKRIHSEFEAMEDYLEETLQDINWPRETEVAAEIRNEGTSVYLDVDLPEVEDMPEAIYLMPQRGFKLSRKALSPTQRQKTYMAHIHSILFRLAGEAFAALPKAQEVYISGFSQRRDKSTGHEGDEYLLAAGITRADWERLDFSPAGLRALDVLEALTRFELRRSMSKSGIFKPIQPFEPPH